jgi:hypothetical protein
MACESVAAGCRQQCGLLAPTYVLGERAPRVEPAPGGWVRGIGDFTGDRVRPAYAIVARVRDRYGGLQRPRVRMPWRVGHLLPRTVLDDLSQVHDGDVVGEMPDHAEVVRDEDECQRQLATQAAEQVDDLGTYGHVQRGHRFVEHQNLRPDRERPCDADALPLTAGELMRVTARGRRRQTDQFEQIARAVRDPVHRKDLGERVADPLPRIE